MSELTIQYEISNKKQKLQSEKIIDETTTTINNHSNTHITYSPLNLHCIQCQTVLCSSSALRWLKVGQGKHLILTELSDFINSELLEPTFHHQTHLQHNVRKPFHTLRKLTCVKCQAKIGAAM